MPSPARHRPILRLLAGTALLLATLLPPQSQAAYRNYNLPCLAPLLLQLNPDAPKDMEQAFIAGPTRFPAPLENIGTVSFPITTTSPDAQPFFNQGVALLHGLWYSEAERNFRKVLDLDPGNPMALWGLAMANELRPGRARVFADIAVRSLRPETTPREKQWIDLIATYFDVATNKKLNHDDNPKLEAAFASRHRQYISDLEQLILDHPDDLEAKAFLVRQLALDQHRLNLPIGSHLTIDRFAKDIADTAPDHPSQHYLVFLWLTENPELTLPPAATGPALAPNIADSWRYAAEAFLANRQYQDAIPLLKAALRVNHQHLLERRLMPLEIENLTANYTALIETLAGLGRITEATKLAEQLATLPRSALPTDATALQATPTLTGRRLFVESLMRAELWDQLLDTLTNNPALQPGNSLPEQTQHLFWKAVAHAHLDQTEQLKALQKELAQALDTAIKRNLAVDAEEQLATLIETLDTIATLQAGESPPNLDPDNPLATLPPETAARLLFQAGLKDQALARLNIALKERPALFLPAATNAELQLAAGNDVGAMVGFTRDFRSTASAADQNLPVLKRLDPVAERMQLGKRWQLPATTSANPDAAPNNPDTLGPLTWSPPAAPDWTLPNHTGREIALEDFRGQTIMLNFFLGVGCVYCAEQLNTFRPYLDKFEQAGIKMIAVSSDSVEGLAQALGDSETLDPETQKLFPFPVLADPEYEVFKQYGAYDDFEQGGMHGTIIIDPEGRQLWSNISHAPFEDPTALLTEAKRLLSLHSPAAEEDPTE
ncbi:MAG: peroxiredoxin family protein [Verrucomicrobiota bacterium]